MRIRKTLAAILCIIYTAYCCPVALFASTISGITPEGNTYNIEADKVSGDTGFRSYDTFQLDDGDVANLNFTSKDLGDYGSFINMVESEVQINGIVNTVRGDAFYNGRAIFVSPSGIVIGATGVLNVGSLNLLSTSDFDSLKNAYDGTAGDIDDYSYGADGYKGLVSDANGNIVMSGTVLSRDEVIADASSISVGGDATTVTKGENGIVAGWNDNASMFTDRDVAVGVFKNLVSGETAFASQLSTNDEGKIVLTASVAQSGDSDKVAPDNGITASVSIDNTDMLANEIDVEAKAKLGSETLPIVAFGKGVYFDYSKSQIGVTGSTLTANNDLTIKASAETSSEINAIELPEVILAWLFESFEDPDKVAQEISSLLSSELFDDFAGSRSYSYLDIDSSTINSGDAMTLATDSQSTYVVKTTGAPEEAIPFQSMIHAIGTETESVINVDKSELNSLDSAEIKALSGNNIEMQISNDNALFRFSETDAFSLQFLNFSTSVDTEVNITDSTITADEITARTLSNVDNFIFVDNSATVLKNDFSTPTEGGSGAALIGIVNNSKTKNEVNITGSTLESTNGNITIEAVSVQNIDVTGKTRTNAEGAKKKEKIEDEKTFFDKVKNRFSNFSKIGKNAYTKYKQYSYGSWYGLFKQFNSGLSDTAAQGAQQAVGEAQELKPGMFQVGGSFLFSNSTNDTAVNIKDSTMTSAKDIDITTHLLDKYHNVALAHAKEPEDASQSTAIVGAGVALIVNNRENTNNVVIDNSKLESKKDVNINALTELPGNGGNVGVSSKYLVLGLGFGSDANDDWSFTFNKNIGDGDRESMSPTLGLTGFFNNAAAAGTTGDSLAVAASITYNNGTNTTNVDIKNDSKIYAGEGDDDGNVRVYATNSVATRSDAGFFGSSSIINYDEVYDVWNSDGTGASVLIQKIENNAEVTIEDSHISANADVGLNAASEQSYVNFIKMFTDAPTIAAGGAVSVQDYTGTTGVNVISGSQIIADNIKVEVGKSRVSLGKLDFDTGDKKGLPVIENDRLVLSDRRNAEDHITTVDVVGEVSKQESEKEKEVTASVGAAVNVHTIDREVNAIIDNAKLVAAEGDVKIDSTSYNRNVELALAGSLAGGAAAETQNVASWQKKAKKSDKSDDFFADMLAKIDDAFPEEEVDEVKEGVDAAKDAAKNVGGSKYSFAIAGSVNVLNNDTKVNTFIRNGAEISATNDVKIASNLKNLDIILSGGFAKSGTVGTGAAVNLFSRGGSVNTTIGGTINGDGTTIVSGANTTVDANEDDEIFSFAVGVGYTGDSSKPTEFDGAIGGSFTYNSVESDTMASVSGATISGKTEAGTDVSVHANQTVSTLNFAGSLATESGSKFSAGAALAGTADLLNSNVGATVKDSVLTDNINNVTVLAEENDDLLSIGVALEAVGNYAKYGTPFDGSLGVVYLDNDIHADLEDSKVTISKKLSVKADNQVNAINAQGDGAYSGATSGIGIGGGWVFDIQNNKVSANLNPGTGDDYKLTSGGLEVNANSFEILNAIPVTVGIARSSSMLASTVVVNLVNNEVSTNVKGTSEVQGDASFTAKDESYLLTRGGTLAVAGSQATTVIGASINLDKLAKTVSTTLDGANITASGSVKVLADSIDANGGTRKKDGTYDRDDISNPDYQEKLLKYDSDKKEYTDLNRDDVDTSFMNWNMFYNLGFGAKSTITGAVVVKLTGNKVDASLKNKTTVFANDLDVIAQDRIVKSMVAGSISATENLGVGVQVVFTKDSPEINALITDNSSVGTADTITVEARDIKDNNTVVVAGTVAMGEGGVIDMNVVLNEFEDKLNASIDTSSSVDSGKLNLEAIEDVNSTRVLVQVSAAQNAAMNVQPLKNEYNENLSVTVDGSTVGTQGNSSTEALVLSSADHKTRDIVVGVAAAAQGVSLTGIAIDNEYNNVLNSSVTSSTANLNTLDVNSKEHIYSDNWAILLEGTGQGLSLGANVIVNDAKFTNTSLIKDSTITASGDVSLSAYSGKDGHYIRNTTGSLGVTGQGAALEANLLLNTYSNKTSASVTGSSIDAADLLIKASGKRSLNNTNITIVAAGEGAALGGSVTYNDVESDTEAVLETDDNDIKLSGNAKVLSEDETSVNNMTGTGAGAAIGGAAMANVVILKNKGTSGAGIKSSGDGKLDAGSVSVEANQSSDLTDASAGLSLGIGSLAGTVKLVTIGEKTSYTDLEKNAGLDTAVSGADDRIKNLLGRNLAEDKTSGAFADINGNVSGKGSIEVDATTSLGTSKAPVSLNNADVTVSGGSAGVGILSLNLNGNSAASISGGTVSTEGELSVSSSEADYADIKSTGLTISGLSFSGGISSYNNNANSFATISDATVSGNNINLKSSTSSEANVEIDGISLGGLATNVAGYETNVNYNSQALVTGKNDISTEGNFGISAASDVNIFSGAKFDSFTGGAAVTNMSTNAVVGGNTTALIKDAQGSINVGHLKIETGYDKMSTEVRNNVVSVSGITITVVNGGVNLNPVFTSGIDNRGNDLTLKIVNTEILSGFSKDNEDMTATSGIYGTGVSLSGYAQSQAKSTSNAVSKTVLKTDSLETTELNIEASLLSNAKASAGQDTISALNGVNAIEIDATATDTLSIEVDGNVTVAGTANIDANHSSKTSVSGDSLAAALFEGVSDLKLNNDNSSDTEVSIKGSLSVPNLSLDIETDRTGALDASNKSGGAVGISNKKFANKVGGKSNLTLDGLTASGDGSGDLQIKIASTNTHDDVSRSSNGGFFVYSKDDYDYEFDTNSSLNIKNSTIDGYKALNIDSRNDNSIKDSSVTTEGGFIVLANSSAGHTFSSSSGVTLENSTISSESFGLTSKASNGSDLDKEITFEAQSGGFYTGEDLELNNTLNQKNEVNIKNTSISAKNDAQISLDTEQAYRQKVQDDSQGFIANPTVKSWLTSNNTNNLEIDEKSSVKADAALTFKLDTNGKLSTFSHVVVKDAGSDPKTDSHLTMKVDNTMTLKGLAEGGSSNSVYFMGSSNNDLHQESYSEHYAVAPFTTEDGDLTRTINNTLTVTKSGEFASGKTIDYKFDSGTGSIYASNHYHCVYYAAFGYETYGETSSKKNLTTNNKADVPGKMAAGLSNSKVIILDEDGEINKSKSSGVYESDFSIYNAIDDPEPEQVKNKVMGKIQKQIDSLSDEIGQIDAGIQDSKDHQDELNKKEAGIDDLLAYLSKKTDEGFSLESEGTLLTRVRNDLAYEMATDETHQISTHEFEALLDRYSAWLGTGDAKNVQQTPDLYYYVHNVDEWGTDERKDTFDRASLAVIARMSTVSDMGKNATFLVYNGSDVKMIASSVEGDSGSKDFLRNLENNRKATADEVKAYENRQHELESAKTLVAGDISVLESDLLAVKETPVGEFGQNEYPDVILFHNLKSTPGTIRITGIDKSDIMVDGKSVGDDLSLLSEHIVSPKNRLEVKNSSGKMVMFKDVDYSGDDSLNFTANGEDVSGFFTSADLYVSTRDKELSLENIGVKNYGVIRNGSKIAEVRNDGVDIRGDSDLQLYTRKTGGFSISMDDSNLVTTTAPVVISNPNLVVKGYLGYHSFDSFAYSEAAVLSDAVRTNLSKADAVSFASDSDDDDLISGEVN